MERSKMILIAHILCTFLLLRQSTAQEQKFQLHVDVARSAQDKFLYQGQPFQVIVTLANAHILQVRESFRETRRRELIENEKGGRYVQRGWEYFVVPEQMNISLGIDNLIWIDNLGMILNRVDKSGGRFPEYVDYLKARILPSYRIDEELVLGEIPVEAIFEVSPSMSDRHVPGTYELIVSYPEAVPDTLRFEIQKPITEESKAYVNYQRAEYSLSHRQFDKSIAYAREAMGKLAYNNDRLYYTLGTAYEGSGAIDSAIANYERFLQAYGSSQTWRLPEVVHLKINALRSKKQERR